MKATYSPNAERGILTSAYKREIRTEMRHSHLRAVSDVKEAISHHCTSTAGTILQVGLFVMVLVALTM
tara:strand:- start:17866 stop:18069 length:204 start_codon:yes stop_codon:yes gene_type:complete